MSLINQVLLDLDRRQASPTALPGAARSMVPPPRDLRWLRWVGLLLMFGGGVAIAVVATQAATEASHAPTATLPAPTAQKGATLPLTTPVPEPKGSAAAPFALMVPSTTAAPETDTASPAVASIAATAPVEQAPSAQSPSVVRTTPRIAPAESGALADRGDGSAPALRAAAPERVASVTSVPVPTTVEKRPRPLAARERAELEYQRGLTLHQQGQPAEAQVAFGAALREDPRYGPARHAVALGLLLDANVKEARSLLAQGLELNPRDALLASTLARITADEDLAGATALLRAALPAPAGTTAQTESAEARALLATLQQRAGNHAEAIDNYSAALRVAPGNGAWWIGLGISLAAAGRADGARQAFEQARSTDALSPELVRYVEQRLAAAAR